MKPDSESLGTKTFFSVEQDGQITVRNLLGDSSSFGDTFTVSLDSLFENYSYYIHLYWSHNMRFPTMWYV